MRGRTFRALIRGLTTPDDDGAEDVLLLTERVPDWWGDAAIWRALRGEYPDYAVFYESEGSAIC